jgi:hypothetical protein
MTKTIKLNEYIYNLLIEKKFDHFTITTLSNTLQAVNESYEETNEARRFVYRQVIRLVNRGLLVRDNNPSPKKAQYSKTTLFNAYSYIKVIKSRDVKDTMLKEGEVNVDEHFQSEIEQKKIIYECELLMLDSEMEEYTQLSDKYPSNREVIVNFIDKTQLRLLVLKGKLTALNNIQRPCK